MRESGEVFSGLMLSDIRWRVPPVTMKREEVNGDSASAETLNVSVAFQFEVEIYFVPALQLIG